MLHQTLSAVLHVDLYLMYVFGLPPLLGVMFSGGIRRTFRGRQAIYWCGFALWMCFAVAFSKWRGGSIFLLSDYLRTDLTVLFIVAGLTITWKECEQVITMVALGAFVDLLTARFFDTAATEYAGRTGLQAGTVANPNDFAGHLVLVLPFLLWISLTSRSKLKKILSLLGIGYGLVLILKTASRGAELGLVVALLFYLLRGTSRQRAAVLLLAPFAVAAFLALVPAEAFRRLQSFSANSGADLSAVESSEARTYLFKKSLQYTVEFPLFGVGPGQFGFWEGTNNHVGSTDHGQWQDTHNSYTQASSECGIPGGLLFIAGFISTVLLFNRTWRAAKQRADCKDIETAVFCMLIGTVGFYATITFLNFAYFFYEPFLAGLAIAVARAARHEFQFRQQPDAPPQPENDPARPALSGRVRAGRAPLVRV